MRETIYSCLSVMDQIACSCGAVFVGRANIVRHLQRGRRRSRCTISPSVMTELGIVQAPCKMYVIARGIGVHIGGCDWPVCQRAHILHVAARLTARRRDSRHRNRRIRRCQHTNHSVDVSCDNDSLDGSQGGDGRGGVCASILDKYACDPGSEAGIVDDEWRLSSGYEDEIPERSVENERDSDILHERLRDMEIENGAIRHQLREAREALVLEQEEKLGLDRAWNGRIVEIDEEKRWLDERLREAIAGYTSVIEETRRENCFLRNRLLDIEKERHWPTDIMGIRQRLQTNDTVLESHATKSREEIRCLYPAPNNVY